MGARLADLQTLGKGTLPRGKKTQVPEGQSELFDLSAFTRDAGLAVGGMLTIQNLPSDGITDIHAKEETLRQLEQAHLEKWQRSAGLWVSAFFGNEMQPEEYAALLRHLQSQQELPENITRQHLNHPAYAENDYFHWELAFPEIFFDRHGNPKGAEAGFDAVIGNPPYVRQETIKEYKPFFQQRYKTYHGSADLYMYFYEQGANLLKDKARIAYISSGTFARANFAKPFRRWLPENTRIETLIDFGENQPFEGAEMVRPTIIVMQKGAQKANFRALFMPGTKILQPLPEAVDKQGFECDAQALTQQEWVFQPVEVSRLASKLFERGTPLIDVVDDLYRGVVSGFNEAFYIDTETKASLIKKNPNSSEVIKPLLRGADLRPWHQQQEGRWLIFTRQGIDISKYPAIEAYLSSFRESLEPRPKDWPARKYWPGRKPGPYKWYEIQDTTAYYMEFEKPKIFCPDIAKLPRFSWDDESYYVNDKGSIISTSNTALLAILQSRVLWFAVSQMCVPLRLRAGLWQYQMKIQFVNRLPIPKIHPDDKATLSEIALQITELAQERYALDEQTRHRIHTDLGTLEDKLNQKLTSWWELDFSTFRAEIKKAFKREIPLKERDDWEAYLDDRREQHTRLTNEIIRLETELNAIVYRLFDLNTAEIEIIEQSTKYPYGAV